MIRNLKALGLAMVAAFALSAVGATAAQALEVNSPDGVTLTGHKISTTDHPEHVFTLSSGRSFKCNDVTFDGTVKDNDDFVTVTPTYSNCFSNGTQPTTVTHNGCNYKFYGTALDNVTVDLECPHTTEPVTKTHEIEVHVYSSPANHTSGTILCTYNVEEFTGKHKNELTKTEKDGIDDVDITTTVSGIAVKRVTGAALACGPENQTAVYTGATTLQAYSDTAHKVPVDLTIE